MTITQAPNIPPLCVADKAKSNSLGNAINSEPSACFYGFFIMQRIMMVNRRRKEVLTKGAVIGVVIGLGAGAVEPLVAG